MIKPNPFRDTPFPGAGIPGGYRAEGTQLVPEVASTAPAISEPFDHEPAKSDASDADDAPLNSSAARRKAALRNKE